MITLYGIDDGYLRPMPGGEDAAAGPDVVWIDLLAPEEAERAAISRALDLTVPTRQEASEIEASSRIFQRNGAVFATASVLYDTNTNRPGVTPVTFILTEARLVTVRFGEPKPFAIFRMRGQRASFKLKTATDILIGLLEEMVERLADILEIHAAEIERLSTRVLGEAPRRTDFMPELRFLGGEADTVGKVRDSLETLNRVILFLSQVIGQTQDKAVRASLKTIGRDIQSLISYTESLSTKLEFLLDATLGVIGIQQNNVMRITSIAAVLFLPPTLIASIYGMNFEDMPELQSAIGYPITLVVMLLCALLPYLYFKWRGWL